MARFRTINIEIEILVRGLKMQGYSYREIRELLIFNGYVNSDIPLGNFKSVCKMVNKKDADFINDILDGKRTLAELAEIKDVHMCTCEKYVRSYIISKKLEKYNISVEDNRITLTLKDGAVENDDIRRVAKHTMSREISITTNSKYIEKVGNRIDKKYDIIVEMLANGMCTSDIASVINKDVNLRYLRSITSDIIVFINNTEAQNRYQIAKKMSETMSISIPYAELLVTTYHLYIDILRKDKGWTFDPMKCILVRDGVVLGGSKLLIENEEVEDIGCTITKNSPYINKRFEKSTAYSIIVTQLADGHTLDNILIATGFKRRSSLGQYVAFPDTEVLSKILSYIKKVSTREDLAIIINNELKISYTQAKRYVDSYHCIIDIMKVNDEWVYKDGALYRGDVKMESVIKRGLNPV